MSGVKTTYVSVEASQWRQAQAAAARLRDVNRELPRMLENVRAQARADQDRALRPVMARAEAAEREINRMSAQAKKFERETNVRLGRQSQAITNLRRDTHNALQVQERAFRAAIDQERAARRQAISALRTEVDALATARERAQETAGQWLSDAEILAGLIRSTLPAERFAPGRLARLERDLMTAGRNLADGHGQTALGVAQQAYYELSDLRFEIESADREWRALSAAAGEALLVVSGLIEEQSFPPAVDENGEPLPDVRLDVDHWSDGALTELRAEVAALLGEIRADSPAAGQTPTGPALTADDLREVIDRHAPAFQNRLADLVEQAALAQLGSQIRVNVAELVVDTLEASGFKLRDHTWEGGDDRAAFVAQVQHPDGGVVVVDVSPVTDQPARCELRILSYEDTGAEEIRQSRASALAAQLAEEGLSVQAPVATADEAEAAMRDLETIRVSAPRRAARARRAPGPGTGR